MAISCEKVAISCREYSHLSAMKPREDGVAGIRAAFEIFLWSIPLLRPFLRLLLCPIGELLRCADSAGEQVVE